jgi:hypothetical protein
MRPLVALAVVATAIGIAARAPLSAPAAVRSTTTHPRLEVRVRDSGSVVITLNGHPALHLSPGWYLVSIVDYSTRENFHLLGPAVNRRTGIRFHGAALWGLELHRGTYRFGSDPLGSNARRLVVG